VHGALERSLDKRQVDSSILSGSASISSKGAALLETSAPQVWHLWGFNVGVDRHFLRRARCRSESRAGPHSPPARFSPHTPHD
jgi:hypothetical protein